MIRLSSIHKSYAAGTGKLHVLKGVDLHIERGELAAIMGSSGSGKSTLLNILGLLDGYDSGEYRLDGELMKDMSETRAAVARSRTIGFVFQSFNLIPFKTALENVALPLYYQRVPRRKRLKVAMEYLERMGIAAWAQHHPGELSGGQKQRVAIARALVSKPKLILADEPTGQLDSATSAEVVEVLQGINRDGVTVVVVTHESAVARACRRIIRIVDGEIAEGGGDGHVPSLAAAEARA